MRKGLLVSPFSRRRRYQGRDHHGTDGSVPTDTESPGGNNRLIGRVRIGEGRKAYIVAPGKNDFAAGDEGQ